MEKYAFGSPDFNTSTIRQDVFVSACPLFLVFTTPVQPVAIVCTQHRHLCGCGGPLDENGDCHILAGSPRFEEAPRTWVELEAHSVRMKTY